MESYFFKNRKKVGSWSHTFCVQGKEETLVPQSNSTLNNSKPPPTKEKPSLSVIKGQSRKLDFDGAHHQSCVVCGGKSNAPLILSTPHTVFHSILLLLLQNLSLLLLYFFLT
jgi:hypothetical protein